MTILCLINAGILYDTWQQAINADLDIVREALETNTFGPWRMCKAFIPLMRRSEHGRIVSVSSEGGSLTNMGGGTPACFEGSTQQPHPNAREANLG